MIRFANHSPKSRDLLFAGTASEAEEKQVPRHTFAAFRGCMWLGMTRLKICGNQGRFTAFSPPAVQSQSRGESARSLPSTDQLQLQLQPSTSLPAGWPSRNPESDAASLRQCKGACCLPCATASVGLRVRRVAASADECHTSRRPPKSCTRLWTYVSSSEEILHQK